LTAVVASGAGIKADRWTVWWWWDARKLYSLTQDGKDLATNPHPFPMLKKAIIIND